MGDPPGQVVGLAARVHDHDGVQLRRQGGRQPLSELDDRLVEIGYGPPADTAAPTPPGRTGGGSADPGRRRAVEVPPVVRIEQPARLAADQVNRVLVEQRRSGQRPAAALQQVAGGRPRVGELPAGITETSRTTLTPIASMASARLPGPGLTARGVGGVARVQPAAPRGDRDLGREPGHHQVREQPGLVLLKWRHRDVAANHRLSSRDGVRAAVQHIRDGHGQIADQRCVGHVPEVHDSAVVRRSSPNSTLSRLRSPWITWARRPAAPVLTRASNRSSTRCT